MSATEAPRHRIEGRFGPPGPELQRVDHPRGDGRSVPLRPARGVGKDAP